ncbi:MAG: hypothetical protein AAB599_01220 [Patescibacteria group bacterium]
MELNEQFFFPTTKSPENIDWMNHPERFQVVFVGPVSDWPNPAAVSNFGMRFNEYLLWVASSHYETERGPACFAIPLKVTLADLEAGLIIKPKLYSDLEVLEEVKAEYRGLHKT